MKKKPSCFFFLMLFFVQIYFGQRNYSFINNYDESKNIASNKVYDITQGERGFLWVATDNGVSLFDGKKFYNYSVEQGLPSNDVLQVFKGKDGKIWANCYMKPLSYFNPKSNRFEIFKQDKGFFNALWTYKYNFDGNYQVYFSKSFIDIGTFPTINKNSLGYPIYPSKNKFLSAFLFLKGKLHLDFIIKGNPVKKIVPANYEAMHAFFFMNAVYAYNTVNELHKYSINVDNLEIKEDVLKIGEKISHFTFNKNFINIITRTGNVYIVDGSSFKVIYKISTGQNPNTVFIDRDQNLWIGTVDNGLLLYKKSDIRKINTKNNEFCSILVEGSDVYSGDYFGELFKNEKKIFDLKNLNIDEKNLRINNIIPIKNDKLLVSDFFMIKNFRKTIFIPKKYSFSIKSSLKISDTLIFLGTSAGLFRYNPINDKFRKNGDFDGRILHLVKTKDDKFFMSTSNEIFQFFLDSDKIVKSDMSKNFEDEFISSMEASSPNLLWISTDKGDIHLFKDLKFLKVINYKQGLSNNILSLKAKNNTLWIGTHSDGLIRMDYSLIGNNINYKFNYIDFLQGLTSNTIDEINFKGDSLVLATDRGISVLSENFKVKAGKSPPIILQTKINDKVVENSLNYHLKKNQHSISFTISNVDFSNSYPEIQYAINEPKNWITLKENIINLEVSSAKETLFLRTASRDNNFIGGTLAINIKKDKYFYESFLFWLIFGGSIIGFLVYLGSKKIISRQRFRYEKELERQTLLQKERERIAHDMHDDLGAGVTAVRFQTLYLKNKNKDNNLDKDINDLLHTAEEIHKSMREILWNLNSGNNNLGDFIAYVEKYSQSFFNNTKINLQIGKRNIESDKLLSQESRRNVFLCIKEALNNIIKHSNAENVRIVFTQSVNYFDITITDDGKGIPKNHKVGNGLQNMKIRMKAVGGTFEIMEVPKGCMLQFRVKF